MSYCNYGKSLRLHLAAGSYWEVLGPCVKALRLLKRRCGSACPCRFRSRRARFVQVGLHQYLYKPSVPLQVGTVQSNLVLLWAAACFFAAAGCFWLVCLLLWAASGLLICCCGLLMACFFCCCGLFLACFLLLFAADTVNQGNR